MEPCTSQEMLSDSQAELLENVADFGFLSDDWWDDMNNDLEEKPKVEPQPKDFVPLGSLIWGEEGQNSREWSDAMDSFGSRKLYEDRLNDFLEAARADHSGSTLEMKLLNYFNNARSQKNEKGEDRYRASSFRSWNSVFSKFWKHCRNQDLKQILPAIEDKIGKWEKLQQEAKQAKTFTKDELITFFEMPTTVENLADKAYAAIALSFAARGVEAAGITWENVSRTIDSVTKESQITIRYKRTKTTGVPETLVALISGRLETKALEEYESCFATAEKTGRYFRKLVCTASGTAITATKQNIGHNTTAKTGVRIANRLGLDSPGLYTGHTFRRTAATICAESGMTLPEIKLVTGKKSKQ